MTPGTYENVMEALHTKTREIIPGSRIAQAFTRLASQALLLGDNNLYQAIRDYTNTQNIKTCNS